MGISTRAGTMWSSLSIILMAACGSSTGGNDVATMDGGGPELGQSGSNHAGSGSGSSGASSSGVQGASSGGMRDANASSGSPSMIDEAGTTDAIASTADAAPPDLPCDPSQKTSPPTSVSFTPMAPPTGPFKVSVETDMSLGANTIYRPEFGSFKNPIIAWAEGGCIKNGTSFAEFLSELASHGFLIIADGAPNGSGGGNITEDGGPQKAMIDWAFKENERPCSMYYHKLDTTKVAVMGQSCGGLMTYGASSDPRVSTVVLWNSGLFQRDAMIYAGLHAPMAIFDGGSSDIAYQNGSDDFDAINTVPIMFANLPVGHVATYFDANGGEFAKAGVGWLKWQLLGDTGMDGKQMFIGPNCGLCSADWVIKTKMFM